MKVEIEKKVKIELSDEEKELLIKLIEDYQNYRCASGILIDFCKQLKQELEK